MRSILALTVLVAAAQPVYAQSEEQLRSFFEGRTVVVRMEMPGSEQGVDVHPGRMQPIDFPRHADRLKDYGTSLRRGQEVLVTKVKVKKDLIEFQLGGGGYGTFGDDSSPSVSVPSAAKTQREKNLDKDIEKTTDPVARRKLIEERDDLRKEREREDARNRAQAAQAQQIKEANIRQRRLESGSRFNIRYEPRVPYEALTPEAVMQALSEYVDFADISGQKAATAAPRAQGPDELRKGLTVDDVDLLLGRPESITQRMEGTLKVSSSSYRSRGRVVVAEFVEGVLIRFTIKSE